MVFCIFASSRKMLKKKLNSFSYGISEQLPAEIMKIRKVKLSILKELSDRNVKAYFVKDNNCVGGKEYIP